MAPIDFIDVVDLSYPDLFSIDCSLGRNHPKWLDDAGLAQDDDIEGRIAIIGQFEVLGEIVNEYGLEIIERAGIFLVTCHCITDRRGADDQHQQCCL